MDQQNSNVILRVRSMCDYNEDRIALINLFRRCEATNQMSTSTSTDGHAGSSAGFHCEFTDYLWCMEQYPESYCIQLVEPVDGRIIFAGVYHSKRVHCGKHIMTFRFGRLFRVDPDRRRQHLLVNFFPQFEQALKCLGFDFDQGYVLTTNTAMLNLQRILFDSQIREVSLLDIFILPTVLDVAATPLKQLNQAETERLWTVDLADWVCRPVLSDLRHIMKMKEYKGTFVVVDISSGRYSAASLWQSSNIILCDDRPDLKDAYRGPYWLAFNFFQSPTSESNSTDQKETLLSALSNAAFNNGIPFMICHVEQSSIFNPICRKRAISKITERLSRRALSERMIELGDRFDRSPVWLDPRDFSALLYFPLLPEKIKCQL